MGEVAGTTGEAPSAAAGSPSRSVATPEVRFASNEVRLSPREWAVALGIVAVVLCAAPLVWRLIEPFDPGSDYRLPYRLGNDYWMYDRYCRAATSGDRAVVLGDSVMWGHYVSTHETLSHFLNERARADRFANLSVDGIHPAAMAGLVRYYGRAISGTRVLLHCNLLWMSSAKHDLQTEKEFSFNHPDLVPQFFPSIRCYRRPYAQRLAVVIGRRLGSSRWAGHLQTAYFDQLDLPTWTLGHPYECGPGAITLELPSPDEPPKPAPRAVPWTAKRLRKFDPPWVELSGSFQWRSFRETIRILRARGNEVFVLIGPFNEHMLGEPGLEGYRRLERGVEAWLEDEGLPYCAPPALPSEQYADASHPLAGGYALLAEQLFQNESFASFAEAGAGRR